MAETLTLSELLRQVSELYTSGVSLDTPVLLSVDIGDDLIHGDLTSVSLADNHSDGSLFVRLTGESADDD